MRIWLVQTGEELPLDGPNTRLLRTALLAEELVKRGHDVTYFNATFNHQRKIQRAEATHIIPRDPAAGRNYACILLAGRAYKKNVSIDRFHSHRENAAAFEKIAPTLPKPDVILCGFPPIELAHAASIFATTHNIPFIIDARDMWPEVIEERLPRLARPLARIALSGLYRQKRRALAGACALTGITDAFVGWGQRGAGRLPRAEDLSFHLTVSPTNIAADALAQGREAWRSLIGHPHQDVILTGCFAGTFATRTDILTIIDGANGLTHEERSHVRIILCGKGDLARQMAKRGNGNPAIVIAGWRNAAEIAALMERSDFGLLPYPNTTDFLASYPNKVGEYLLAGLPIMTGLMGVTGSLLDAEGLALRYTHGDASSVTTLLRSLLDNPTGAEQRTHARTVGQKHFDPKRIYPAFADWLEALAKSVPVACVHNTGKPYHMTANFVTVTEIAGQRISLEQLHRTCHRYHWAAGHAVGKDVLEVACGAGQGLGLLQSVAKSIVAGDVSPEVLAATKATYGDRIPLSIFGAEALPFADTSLDLVLMFEALYYVPNPSAFFAEARRVLRPGGRLLIASANKDLYDFTPSPYSSRYLGVLELAKELGDAGFATRFAGHIDTRAVPLRQRVLRPVKLIASKLGLIPKTMHGKEWLKKLFFGSMTTMPADISAVPFTNQTLTPILDNAPDKRHKVIYCQATRPD